MNYPFKKHRRSRNPAFNVPRRKESVGTDWVWSDTPAIDDGSKGAQLFIGLKSMVSDAQGAKTDGEFVSTLQDNIRKRGAMDKLISDRAQSEVSNSSKDVLRALLIPHYQSEPHHQHQNFAEHCC